MNMTFNAAEFLTGLFGTAMPAESMATNDTAVSDEPLCGWPQDVPLPTWWAQIAVPMGNALLAASRHICVDHYGYSGCGFPVAVEWSDSEGLRHWSCPRCGLAAPTSWTPHDRHDDSEDW